jgi:hypothetical protein
VARPAAGIPSPPLTTKVRVLLALTVIGFVVPNVFVVVFLAREGLDLDQYFGGWFEVLSGAQLTIDLLIAAVAFLIWTAWDGTRSGVARWWLAIPATGLVGLCFGLPLYLYLRERELTRSEAR